MSGADFLGGGLRHRRRLPDVAHCAYRGRQRGDFCLCGHPCGTILPSTRKTVSVTAAPFLFGQRVGRNPIFHANLDGFAVSTLIFCFLGLLLGRQRGSTGRGVQIPVSTINHGEIFGYCIKADCYRLRLEPELPMAPASCLALVGGQQPMGRGESLRIRGDTRPCRSPHRLVAQEHGRPSASQGQHLCF